LPSRYLNIPYIMEKGKYLAVLSMHVCVWGCACILFYSLSMGSRLGALGDSHRDHCHKVSNWETEIGINSQYILIFVL
jgi:hypothetical protein